MEIESYYIGLSIGKKYFTQKTRGTLKSVCVLRNTRYTQFILNLRHIKFAEIERRVCNFRSGKNHFFSVKKDYFPKYIFKFVIEYETLQIHAWKIP